MKWKYDLEDNIPFRENLIYSFQQVVLFVASAVVMPVVVGYTLGLTQTEVAETLQRTFVLCGVMTLLQVRYGHRFPIQDGPAGLWSGLFLTMAATLPALGKTLPELRTDLEMGMMIGGGVVVLFAATGASKKINAAYGMDTGGKGGNIEQMGKEIERLMGFRPDKYVIVNFDGIAAIVDAIGGVDYDVPFDMKYDDPSQNLHIDLKKGQQHLDGKQTVGFLRWRHNNDYTVQYTNGDEGRVENQQKFLKSLAGQVLQIKNVTKIRSIAEAVFKNVKTDFSAGELLWMGMQAMQIDNSSIQFFTLPGYGKMSTAGTSVQYSFFFPYYDQTLELVNKYFNPYEEPISKLDIVGGPDTTTYSGGYVSSGEEDNVWGDTSGSYDYSEDYYEEPDYSYDEPSYDNSGSDGDYSDNNDYSGGDSGGDYSGGDSGEESGGDYSGGDYTGGGEDSGASSGGDDGGTYDPEA